MVPEKVSTGRPGAGDEPGDHGTPRVFPRRLPRTSLADLLRRALQITRAVVVHFTPLAARTALARLRRRPDERDAWARPLRRTFEDLGATFMKFGQLVGSSPGIFGDAAAAEFRSCLDTGPSVPFAAIRDAVEHELGMPLEEAFSEFCETPIGRASIAVVHRAVTTDGRPVAVKVLRPGIEHRVATDLDLFQPMLEVVARLTGEFAANQMLSMFQGFRVQIGEELDLRNEARAMTHYRGLLDEVDLPRVMVPEVHHELSGARVLTMELLDGVPVDDLARVEEFGYDPRPVVQEVIKGFFLTSIRWGTFHGDVHAGNLMLLPDGRLGVLDWGIVGRLDEGTHGFFRNIIRAGLGEESAWSELALHAKAVYGPVLQDQLGMDDQQLEGFLRMALGPVLSRPFGEVSLADLINAPQQAVAEAQGRGPDAPRPTLTEAVRRFRRQRKLRASMEDHGFIDSDFDRGMFLLSKQLMYFERYGKMFLSDTGLFEDEEFFRAVLDMPTSVSGAHGT